MTMLQFWIQIYQHAKRRSRFEPTLIRQQGSALRLSTQDLDILMWEPAWMKERVGALHYPG